MATKTEAVEAPPTDEQDSPDTARQFTRNADGSFDARFDGMQLRSAFQPIFSFAHPQPVGYESLLRARDAGGAPIPPVQLFHTDAKSGADTHRLERVSQALHIRNFSHAAPDDCWIFLNLSPNEVVRHVQRGGDLSRVVKRAGVAPHRIVVEVVEAGIGDQALLRDVIQQLRSFGCLIAIDDFGAGHSNFNRIWALQPDIVKLDRSITEAAARETTMRRSLPNLSSLIHEAGAMVLLEGVETEDEALIGMEADVDLYQGYLFGRPEPFNGHRRDHPVTPSAMGLALRSRLWGDQHGRDEAMRAVRVQFDRAKEAVRDGKPLAEACAGLMNLTQVARCFVVDGAGEQAHGNISANAKETMDLRFRPMQAGRGAIWHLRHYFRRAIAEPEMVQISRPYFSLTGAHMVVTLSVAILRGAETIVLCCDVDWLGLEAPSGRLH